MSALARAGRRGPPHTTVVTDFVAHSQWIAPGIDRYCVAADEVGHDLVARGIPRERVVVTGVPVRTEFASAPDPREMRRALGLPAEVPVVLAVAMAVEVPLLFYGSLPGQERRNERFAASAGVALVARGRPDLERLLDRALRDPDLLEHLRAPMRARRRPDATRAIVDLVLADCVRAGAPR